MQEDLPGDLPMASSEGQLRPLMVLDDIPARNMVWRAVQEHVSREGGLLTRQLVTLAVSQCLEGGGVNGLLPNPHTHLVYFLANSTKWYMSDELLDACRKVLGTIHLDACSDEEAQARVGAIRYITEDQDAINPSTAWGLLPPHELAGLPVNTFVRQCSWGDKS